MSRMKGKDGEDKATALKTIILFILYILPFILDTLLGSASVPTN
jgi:hypothetical protein